MTTAINVKTAALRGIEAVTVETQVRMSAGLPSFIIVGLADKAVAESRERVRAALSAIGLSLPPKRLTVNLSPADLPKEGSHYDLPIALGVLAAMGAVPSERLENLLAMGELSLEGELSRVAGALPAAVTANERGLDMMCPPECGAEAAWAGGDIEIVAPRSLAQAAAHLRGDAPLARAEPGPIDDSSESLEIGDVKGQESAKRALEVAAAGGHHVLMIGPPGSGKSLLAERFPSLLPPMDAAETLETSMIASSAGLLAEGRVSRRRPFRAPHHSASRASLVGGGRKASPGEASLAHNGALFLDELPEFHPQALEALRQPLEIGRAVIARAEYRVSYPARFQLVAAMNPCRCGGDADGSGCRRGPKCAADYQSRISAPLLDRIDIRLETPPARISDLGLKRREGERSRNRRSSLRGADDSERAASAHARS